MSPWAEACVAPAVAKTAESEDAVNARRVIMTDPTNSTFAR
jgi:hypothetical protein